MKKKYFYITTLAFDNVFKTQVISWLNLYKEHKINFKLIKLIIFRGKLVHNKVETERKIKSLYSGYVISKYYLPSKYLFFQVINAIFITIYLWKGIFSKSKLIIQTRNPDLHFPLRILKGFAHSRISIIYDCRAAGAEEFIYKQSLKNIDSKSTLVYRRILRHEIKMVKLSDKVFTVSNNLKNYFMDKANCPEEKFFVYPCNADSNDFYYDIKEREKIRKELGIQERILLCYSGGFNLPWHLPKETLSFFKSLYLQNNNYFLVLLTNDVDEAKKIIQEVHIPDSAYILKSVQNSEVRKYLSASDFGLLFRDNVPMNNVASPTKFAEYIMCGLPIIISNGVGDFTQFVISNQVGIHISNFQSINFSLFDSNLLSYHKNLNRENIAQIGRTNFSKQSLLPLVLKQYSKF